MTTTHHCQTIADAGRCPECRPRHLAIVADGKTGWLLTFYAQPAGGEDQTTLGLCVENDTLINVAAADPGAIAIVRSWDPTFGGAVDAAWATGCNPGGAVNGQSLPVEVIERSGVPLFTLLRGAEADAARHQLARALGDEP